MIGDEDWGDDQQLLMRLLVTLHQMQEFLKSEGYDQADFDAYVANTSPRALH